MVQALNSELNSICTAANPVDESIETESETDSVEFNSRGSGRKVTFGEHPLVGVNIDNTARNVRSGRLPLNNAMVPSRQSFWNYHESTRERPPIITTNPQNPVKSRMHESLPTPTNYSSQDGPNRPRNTESLSVVGFNSRDPGSILGRDISRDISKKSREFPV